jgi:hypothetical protein
MMAMDIHVKNILNGGVISVHVDAVDRGSNQRK